MNASIMGNLRQYILEELKRMKISDNYDYRDNDSRSKAENIGYVKESAEVDSEYFSEDLFIILSSLSELERTFISLKYQKQFENGEIAKMLNMSLSEIEKLDFHILSYLREREDVKRLIKNSAK